MRLFLPFLTASIPRGDGTYDRPPALVNVNVLNFNVLLTLAAVTVEGFGQSREGPGELVPGPSQFDHSRSSSVGFEPVDQACIEYPVLR
jgi:hypothetical protein